NIFIFNKQNKYLIEMSIKSLNLWVKKLVILGIFIGIIIITAEFDWSAEHTTVGIFIRFLWLASLLIIGISLSIFFIYFAGNIIQEKGKSDKMWFYISIILFIIANGIPIIFYVILEISPGFIFYLQIILMGLLSAFIIQPKNLKTRFLIILISDALILVPLIYLVNSAINDLWAGIPTTSTIYYLSFWGLLMPFLYLILAISWKFGGGTKCQSWNIFVSAMLLQTSTLEDFFYFFINGQPLPGMWPWMQNFVINLEVLFGHIPTDLDILIFCSIITPIAIFILFDVHGYIWEKIKSKK
ncbi:MAG: hypothetical protein ACTSYZ_10070, partial [Candidatus Helarchaeota archaeon]